MKRLILVRHGESVWNRENRFTGWYDCPLSEKGLEEAMEAGRLLVQNGLIPEVIHSSVLRRALETVEQMLKEIRKDIPIHKSWRLNERHYGDLTGLDKKQAVVDFGKEQVFTWRRKFDIRPPEISQANPYRAEIESQYPDLTPEELPKTECLADVIDRILPYLADHIMPDFKKHEILLIAAHGNSLRAIVKHLENMSAEEISSVNIPTGIPLVYELHKIDGEFKPTEDMPLEMRYLGGAEAAAKAAAKVAEQTNAEN